MRKAKVPSLETTERTMSPKHTRGEGPPNLFVFAFVCFGTNRSPGAKKRQSAFIATGSGEFWKAGNNNHPSP